MYVYPQQTHIQAGLGQDDSGIDFSGVADSLASPLADTSFLSSPLFLGGLGLLALAYVATKGKKVMARRRKSSAKRAAIRARIQTLRAQL
jgi:hypothetical protein